MALPATPPAECTPPRRLALRRPLLDLALAPCARPTLPSAEGLPSRPTAVAPSPSRPAAAWRPWPSSESLAARPTAVAPQPRDGPVTAHWTRPPLPPAEGLPPRPTSVEPPPRRPASARRPWPPAEGLTARPTSVEPQPRDATFSSAPPPRADVLARAPRLVGGVPCRPSRTMWFGGPGSCSAVWASSSSWDGVEPGPV